MNLDDLLWLVPLGVGIVARAWKRRTGVGWTALTFVVIVALWALFVLVTPNMEVDREHGLALRLMAYVMGGVLMLIVVACVPKWRPRRRTCPFCTETIRVEAVKCRYCQSAVPPVASPALPA
jgi:hypothetical protein